MQRWEEVGGQWLGTCQTRNPRVALTLSADLVANTLPRAAHIATAVLAAKQRGTVQIEGTIPTLLAAPALSMRLAGTLSGLRGTGVQCGNSTICPTIANLTSLSIADVQVPVQWLALIADPARHSLLALAELTHGHRSASGELIDHSCRITVAVLAAGEVVEALLTGIALTSVKVGLTQALSV